MKQCFLTLFWAFSIVTACTPKEEPLPEVDDVCTMMDDLVFMKYCYDNFDVNHDGKVSKSEAEAVTKIDMYSNDYSGPFAELKSLKGLEYFTNLVELDCTKTSLLAIDVTRNTKLEIIALGGTRISSINTSKCTALKELYVWETNITQLDVSKNAELIELDAEHLDISRIDVSKCPNLTTLYLSHTNVTELDISHNNLIDALAFGKEGLTVRINCVKVPVNYWSYGDGVVFSCNGKVVPSGCYFEWDGKAYNGERPYIYIGVGETITIKAVPDPNYADASFIWESNDDGVASVQNGAITGKKEGTATISAIPVTGGKMADCLIGVKPAAKSVKIIESEKPDIMEVGNTWLLMYSLLPDGAANRGVQWSSSNPEVVEIVYQTDIYGNITTYAKAIAPGKATISVKTVSGGVTATSELSVIDKIIPVTDIRLNKKNITLLVGQTDTLVATISPNNTTYKSPHWHSSAPSVATISEEGIITAIKAGTAYISCDAGNQSAGCWVTVTSKIQTTGVSLNKTSLSMTEGETQTLTASVSPSNATNKNVTWSSSNTSVATVSSSGVVTAKGAGTAIITVKTLDGSKTATCSVTVSSPAVGIKSISLSKSSLELVVGQSSEISITASPTNWSGEIGIGSSNTSVASVTVDGTPTFKVNALSPGTSVITVKDKNGSAKATCTVTVKAATVSVTGVSLNKTSLSMTEGETQTLTASVSPSNATNKNVTWSSSNTSVATVSSSGVVTAKSAGSATITVKTTDGSKTATCSVTVSSPVVGIKSITLSKSSLGLVVGQSSDISIAVSPANCSGEINVWSSNTTVASVTVDGTPTFKVNALSPGTSVITVKDKNGSAQATCSVTVKAATVAVTGVSLNKTSLSMKVGESQTLTATVSPSNATNKNVTWSSSNTSVATVSSSGVITAKSAGSATITVKTTDGSKTATCSVAVAATNNNPNPGESEGTSDEELNP